ncbi:MAG: methyltransferase domain-containing protein [Deltaproteobacteria bacterium]|nr:methyltransferase domain-containing protein [Deltaproteobacteria bacterium]
MQTDSKPSIPRGAEFHEQIASNWGAGYAQGSFKQRLELFNSILDRSGVAGQRWLDLGCGSGVLTKELLARGARVVALDGSPSMLEAARRSVDTTASELVAFRQGDVQDLSWSESGAFDGVLCSSVVEYVDAPDELIRQVSRVLKAGGLLIISMPPKRSLIRTWQKVSRFIYGLLGKDRHSYLAVSRFEIDRGAVAGWLRGAGLRLEHVSGFDPILSSRALKLFFPALLVCEARRLG